MPEEPFSRDSIPGGDLKPDELIERLIPDPTKGQRPVARLVGLYLGNSSRPDYWRLYVSHKLDRYFEFRKEDVLEAERPETGRVVVWLKPDSKVDRTITQEVSEEFLRGEIEATQLGRVNGLPDLRKSMALALGSCGCPEPPKPGDGGATGFGGTTCPTDGCRDSLNKC